jgi:hypothetical protein
MANQKGITMFRKATGFLPLLTTVFAFFFSTNVHANFFTNISIVYDESTFMQWEDYTTCDTHSAGCAQVAAEASHYDLSNSGYTLLGNDVNTTAVAQTLAWGGDPFNSSFAFEGNNFIFDNSVDTLEELDALNWASGAGQVNIGQFVHVNGETPANLNLSSASFDIQVQIFDDTSGTCAIDNLIACTNVDLVRKWNFDPTQELFRIDITNTINTQANPNDTVCGSDGFITMTSPDGVLQAEPFYTSQCMETIEGGMQTAYDVMAVLSSVYVTEILPASPGAAVTRTLVDGTVERIVFVPEPSPLLLVLLGMLIMGYQLRRKNSQ